MIELHAHANDAARTGPTAKQATMTRRGLRKEEQVTAQGPAGRNLTPGLCTAHCRIANQGREEFGRVWWYLRRPVVGPIKFWSLNVFLRSVRKGNAHKPTIGLVFWSLFVLERSP